MNYILRNNLFCKLDFRFEFNRYLIGLKLNYDYKFNVWYVFFEYYYLDIYSVWWYNFICKLI